MITIAVGVGENKNILEACDIFKTQKPDVNIELIENDEKLAKSISDKNIDATIRGSLAASNILKQLKESYPKISRATYIHGKGHEFIISSVGIDEGNTLKEKLNIAVHCIDFMKKLKKTPKIATLSYARPGDYGRSEEINQSLDDAKKLTQLIEKHTNQKIENSCVLIDQAIKNKCNIYLACKCASKEEQDESDHRYMDQGACRGVCQAGGGHFQPSRAGRGRGELGRIPAQIYGGSGVLH